MTASPDASHDWLHERTQRTPDREALINSEQTWSFAELDARSDRIASELVKSSVERGNRIALLAGNTASTVAAVHAVPRSGATLVPLNTRLKAPELRHQIRVAEPSMIIADEAHHDLARALVGDIAVLSLEELSSGPSTSPPRTSIDTDFPHTVMFTSGTTGAAKGVMLSAGNHYHSAIAAMINMGVSDTDRWLCCVPLFHMAGLSILLRSAIFGIPVVLQRAFDPDDANRAIETQRVSIASLVPTMLSRMLEARDGQPFPSTFRSALTGGGSLSQELLQRCSTAGIPITQTYGLTETASQVVTLAPSEALIRLGAAGKALWGSEVRIVDERGDPVGVNDPGEIQVAGTTVMAGYLDDPIATARAFDGRWLRTGDIGRIDEDGYLHVLDRRTDLIISGGENIYPAEVESVLLSQPGVQEAAVVGLPHPDWGQRPVAFVVPSGATIDELVAHCAANLAAYKCPDTIHFVAALPRTAAGKLQRHLLRKQVRPDNPA